jgi:hypothetical protein
MWGGMYENLLYIVAAIYFIGLWEGEGTAMVWALDHPFKETPNQI